MSAPKDREQIQAQARRDAGDDWCERNLVFTTKRGIPIEPRNFNRSLEKISRLVGHSSTAVTELAYRKQIRPVIQEGATAMDRIFKT